MTNTIYEAIVKHLNAGVDYRIVIAVQGGYKAPVLAPKDLPTIKPDGTGIRFGKTYAFVSQVKFARLKAE